MVCEIYVLLGMTACGAALGMLFDLRRGINKAASIPDFAVAAADFMYWIICAVSVTCCIWYLNNGIVRIYEFTGLVSGAVLYFLTLSKPIIAVSEFMTKHILKILSFIFKILLTPLRFLYKIISSLYIKCNNKERLTEHERDERESV